MLNRVGLLGATGWMGALLGRALLSSKTINPDQLSCLNRNASKGNVSKGSYDEYAAVRWVGNYSELIEHSDTLILSVRPEQFRACDFVCGDKLVISVMAGISMEELAERTRASRIIRAMPNSAAEIGRSFTPWLPSPAIAAADRHIATEILEAIGTAEQVSDEQQLNFLTGLSGAGPAYSALLISALSQAATDAGLPRETALKAATATAVDAAQLLSRPKTSAEAIVQDFIDYDGVIAAALIAAQTSGFKASINQALLAASQKVVELATE